MLGYLNSRTEAHPKPSRKAKAVVKSNRNRSQRGGGAEGDWRRAHASETEQGTSPAGLGRWPWRPPPPAAAAAPTAPTRWRSCRGTRPRSSPSRGSSSPHGSLSSPRASAPPASRRSAVASTPCSREVTAGRCATASLWPYTCAASARVFLVG